MPTSAPAGQPEGSDNPHASPNDAIIPQPRFRADRRFLHARIARSKAAVARERNLAAPGEELLCNTRSVDGCVGFASQFAPGTPCRQTQTKEAWHIARLSAIRRARRSLTESVSHGRQRTPNEPSARRRRAGPPRLARPVAEKALGAGLTGQCRASSLVEAPRGARSRRSHSSCWSPSKRVQLVAALGSALPPGGALRSSTRPVREPAPAGAPQGGVLAKARRRARDRRRPPTCSRTSPSRCGRKSWRKMPMRGSRPRSSATLNIRKDTARPSHADGFSWPCRRSGQLAR